MTQRAVARECADWIWRKDEESALPLKLDGLNIYKTHENFVRQIAGEMFSRAGETLKEFVERDVLRQELQCHPLIKNDTTRRT